MRRLLAGTLALLLVLGAGIWLGSRPAELPQPVRELLGNDPGSLSAQAAALIEANYFREVSDGTLEDGSVAGMVRAIKQEHEDRFSHYFDPEAMEQFDDAISGSFSGVGLSVIEVPRGLRVTRVFGGTPAEGAGIEVGEVIVAVDGEPVAGVRAELVTRKIKGPEGSPVRLGLFNPAASERRQVRLVRRQIEIPPTRGSIREVGGARIGYLQLATFSRGAHQYVRRGMQRLRARGAQGVLLDLRANGGGLLSEAVLTSSVFVPEGEIVVSTRSRTEGDREYEALGTSLPPLPMAVLIDGNTASAAEILAAALEEYLDAPLIGSQTFGKTVFQKVIDLSNGGALDLTIGEYYGASGTSLAGEGLEPQIPVEDRADSDADEAFRRGLAELSRRVRASGGA